MGWFGRGKRIEQTLDRLASGIEALAERLTAPETQERTERRGRASGDAATALAAGVPSLIGAAVEMMKMAADTANKSAERAVSRAYSSTAAEMGARGRKKQLERRAEQQQLPAPTQLEQTVALIKANCEECAAKLERRAVKHGDHLSVHMTEQHDSQILGPILNQMRPN